VPGLLAAPLASQGLFHSAFLSGFKVKRVFLDLFDDVFLLDLSFETAKSVFQRLTVLKSNFSQRLTPPFPS
jgi:hypothetical protein